MRLSYCIMAPLLLFFLFSRAERQPEYPKPGNPCPSFVLHNIRYYNLKEARLEDFRGKWLVLDFWNKYCGACVASFPKVSKLQQQFGQQVQFMLVGIQDRENQIEAMYRKYRETEGLVMPCAFDSALANRLDIYTAPYIIVIDPKGIVQTITYSLSAPDVEGFLSGHPPRLQKAYRVHEEITDRPIAFDRTRPFLVGGNGGNDTTYLVRSVLSQWDGFIQPYYIPETIMKDSVLGLFQVLGVPLQRLYNYAYYGQPSPSNDYRYDPVLETKDTAMFHWSSASSTNLFAYSFQCPPARMNRKYIQRTLQKDLENYFGYKVSLETRSFPCWHLIANSTTARKLKSHGGRRHFETKIPHADFTLRNEKFENFIEFLSGYSGRDIVDKTGIKGNIDIELSGFLDGPSAVEHSLLRYGLRLVASQRPMRVLVIKDKL